MSKSKTIFLTTALTFLIGVGAAVFIAKTTDIDIRPSAIDKVKLEFRGQTIHLNVFLNEPLTCKQVIDELGVEHLPVKKKIYVPSCTIIRSDYIKIVFEEQILA